MTHSDINGLILPPLLAPIQVVIIPKYKKINEFKKIKKIALKIKNLLKEKNISVKFDDRKIYKFKQKSIEYEKKGIPIRINIETEKISKNKIEILRRDINKKTITSINKLEIKIINLLNTIQKKIYNNALKMVKSKTKITKKYEEFKKKN